MRRTSWFVCWLLVAVAVCVTAAQRGTDATSGAEAYVGTWSGSWGGSGSGGSFELTLDRGKEGAVTAKVAVTGEPSYAATCKSIAFEGPKMRCVYDFPPDQQAEVLLAAAFEGTKATGTWSLRARGTETEVVGGTWTVTKK